MFVYIHKYFWIVFIVVTTVNAFILQKRVKAQVDFDASLQQGYDQLFKGMLILMNIPWLIMGFGILSGRVNTMFDFFHPSDLDPMVLIFHGYIYVLYVLSIWWIYFRQGAEFLERHKGFIQVNVFGNKKDPSAHQIKLFYPFMLLGAAAALVMMWIMPMQKIGI